MLVALLVFIALALVGRVSRPPDDQAAWLLWRENQEDRRDDG